jgi:hypothetical protein
MYEHQTIVLRLIHWWFSYRSLNLYNYRSCFMQEVMAWTSWGLLMVVMASKLLELVVKTRRFVNTPFLSTSQLSFVNPHSNLND